METPLKRLVIVSNRLPIVIEKHNGDWQVKQGSGGLVTALAPVLRNRGGVWIGWPGTSDTGGLKKPLQEASGNVGYKLKPVVLTPYEVDMYYYGLSNEIIWPLFHDLQSRCNFDAEYWSAYQQVNKKFAETIIKNTKKDDYIWVHDYHLMSVARELRALQDDLKVGFFLHTPFPPPDIFFKLPWRSELINSLMEYDLIGFQTMRDRRNFIQCVRTLVKGTRTHGKGAVVTLQSPERKIKVGNFPISIDYRQFEQQAATREVADSAWYIHENLSDRQIILGIDRLDYTKGIIERLKAFERALIKYSDLHQNVNFIQIVVPSRVHIPEYQTLRTQIEQTVSAINGRFSKYGWVPIHYMFRSLDRYELLGYYRTAEIAFITPLKDGMNLVAKEYCSCNLEETGVLILSEFAGATAQLHKYALIVNPYDLESVADAIYRAYTMGQEERLWRMGKLRQSIRRYDIFWWVDAFMQAAFTEKLYNFPVLEDYDYASHAEIMQEQHQAESDS